MAPVIRILEGQFPLADSDPEAADSYDLVDPRSRLWWSDIVEQHRGQFVRVVVEVLPPTRRRVIRTLAFQLGKRTAYGYGVSNLSELDKDARAAWLRERNTRIQEFLREQDLLEDGESAVRVVTQQRMHYSNATRHRVVELEEERKD